MKLRFASVLISSLIACVATAQQQSPFGPTGVNQPTAGQSTTPANQGVATNPTGDALTPAQPDPAAPASGGIATNSTGGSAFGLGSTNQLGAGSASTAPLFLNVTATTITDANGSPLGVLQQLALTPSGTVNFGIVNMGGRLVPVPWQLIVNGTGGARGTLAVNADAGLLRSAPPVLMNQMPTLTQDEVQAQILNHFGLRTAAAQPTVVTTGTARGGTGGAGVTITGGSTNTATFGTFPSTNNIATSTNAFPNTTRSNQAVNTTSGLLSPTGRTNGISDQFNSGPGSTDRFGPRQNANPTQPPPNTTPPATTPSQPVPPVTAPPAPAPQPQ